MREIRMPEAGFSITEGRVVEWYKRVGEQVAEGENVVSVETDKITVEVPAEAGGTLEEIRYKEGDMVPVGAVMGIIGEGKGEPRIPQTAAKLSAEKRISPAAKAEARARGVDLSRIETGSGPQGRIVKKDVEDFVAKQGASGAMETVKAAKETVKAGVAGAPASTGKTKRVDFKGWRKVLADRMLASSREIPRYTMSVEADVCELSRMIKRLRERREDLRVTYLPFMMKAMAFGVEEVSHVNAHCDGEGYTVFDEVNIGIAVDLGEKLLVPVVRGVREKSILELARELEGLVKKARADKLEPRDIEGGTITLTNVGMFQTVSATSIIMPPQVAILYMGVAREVPAVWEGRIEARMQMSFGATYDHRVVNGAAGGRFLLKVKETLEDPSAFIQ
jgi:pyruvate/2-oxoglutarate dehydrogenase complex dihydrolipoamide acyltransferase (E2) component